MNPRSRAFSNRHLLLLLAAAFLVLYVSKSSCTKSGHSKLVVPDAFHGLVRISISDDCTPPAREADGTLVWIVSCSGSLEICDFAPFNTWHKFSIVTDQDRWVPDRYGEIPPNQAGSPLERSLNKVYVSLGNSDNEYLWYFIGSMDEYSKTVDGLAPYDWRLGSCAMEPDGG